MKKTGLLSLLAGIKIEAEDKEISELIPLKILDAVVDYLNDPQIREAIDEIPF